MNDPVSHTLRHRQREPEGLSRMLTISLVVHAVVLAIVVLTPWSIRASGDDVAPMYISLGGAPGPRTGGMTPMGGRPVQRAEPEPEERRRPEPVRPPAAKPPEMTAPTPRERVAPPRPEPVKTTTEEARGRTPTTGPEERRGDTPVDTGAQGPGSGLSAGGAGLGGRIDVGNFCCPEYLSTMIELIRRNWNQRQMVTGANVYKFVIQRDGTIVGVEIERPSGYPILDLTSQRALMATRLPPLPVEYTNPQLTVHLTFEYLR